MILQSAVTWIFEAAVYRIEKDLIFISLDIRTIKVS